MLLNMFPPEKIQQSKANLDQGFPKILDLAGVTDWIMFNQEQQINASTQVGIRAKNIAKN